MQNSIDFNEEILHQHFLYSKNYSSYIDRVTHSKIGTNEICGDKINVNLHISNNQINDINFEGSCCTIVKASASLMTDQLNGKSLLEAEYLYHQVQDTVKIVNRTDDYFLTLILQLSAIAKQQNKSNECLLLPWITMYKAIKSKASTSNLRARDYTIFLE